MPPKHGRFGITCDLWSQLIFSRLMSYCVGCLPRDLMVLQIGPQVELVLPLVHRHAVGHETQYALLDA